MIVALLILGVVTGLTAAAASLVDTWAPRQDRKSRLTPWWRRQYTVTARPFTPGRRRTPDCEHHDFPSRRHAAAWVATNRHHYHWCRVDRTL